MMQSKIKIGDLRHRMTLYPVIGYNNATTGVPEHTYATTGTDIFCKAVLNTRIVRETDKTHTVQETMITVRLDEITYKIEDKIVLNGKTMYIQSIKEIDLWYQTLTCTDEY